LGEPAFRQKLEEELTANILPFWMAHVVDRVHGGFYGALNLPHA
jgi:mannose/cellobiose epimerase-like protein (N-acyl-D-glucosamine 2-epimerase family)